MSQRLRFRLTADAYGMTRPVFWPCRAAPRCAVGVKIQRFRIREQESRNAGRRGLRRSLELHASGEIAATPRNGCRRAISLADLIGLDEADLRLEARHG
jgi:hypothetical protein